MLQNILSNFNPISGHHLYLKNQFTFLSFYLRQGGYVFTHVICLFVGSSAELHKYWMDFHDTWVMAQNRPY